MLLTIASFLGMAIAARQLSYHMSTFEILALRSIVGLCILIPLILKTGRYQFFSRKPRLQIIRNCIHFGGQYGWTLGIALLPLAEVFALEFTVPIWVALLALLFLGERLTFSRAVAIVGGFAGVLVIVRPGAELVDSASLIVLGAALCFAGSVVMTKSLTSDDSALTILFYMSFVQLPLALIPALFTWVTPTISDVPWFVLIAVGALGAHYGMAKALKISDASSIFPVDFLRLPAIAIIGYLLYNEALEIWVFVGALLIFGANYYNLRTESARR